MRARASSENRHAQSPSLRSLFPRGGGGYFLGINCVNSSTQDSPYCVRAGLSQYNLENSLFSRGISSHDEIDTWATLFHSFF